MHRILIKIENSYGYIRNSLNNNKQLCTYVARKKITMNVVCERQHFASN